MFIEILKYGFLVIFFATAVIGIAGIPEWIKIPEYYRKRIFIALILEVVGVIIILFRQEVIETDQETHPQIELPEKNWMALNASGVLVKPKVSFSVNDTTITKPIGVHSYLELDNLAGQVNQSGLSVINADSQSLGTIEYHKLKACGLFNSFATAADEISSTQNYAYVKWGKLSSGQWSKKGQFVGPFEFEIRDTDEGTHYRIRNTETNTIVDDSKNYSSDLFGVDNRKIHFLRHDNVYYLLRIAMADLSNENKYVHVINARLEPTFKEPS